MSKSVLYAGNSVSQATLSTGSVINFGSIVRRYGCNCNLSGGNVVVRGTGYYDIDTNFTIVPTATGTLTITLFNGGVEVPNANVSLSVTASDTYTVSIPAVIRETCGCENTITAVISDVSTNITNAAIIVEKL